MITRFAPSPTGPLHLGHAFSALYAWDLANKADGQFLLRIEDIDRARSRAEWETGIYRDLEWLGLEWSAPVLRQSARLATYQEALQELWQMGLLYPCTCRRKDIQAALSAPQEGAPLVGPDGLVYPGTCRNKTRPAKMPSDGVLRLDLRTSLQSIDKISFFECGKGPDGTSGHVHIDREMAIERIGDVVLARRDMGTSYHLSVVLDDAAQGITHVTRGNDLFEATPIHVILQRLLGLPTPKYHHHRLIRDAQGKRLAKRDDAKAISLYRKKGLTPADLRAMVGL